MILIMSIPSGAQDTITKIDMKQIQEPENEQIKGENVLLETDTSPEGIENKKKKGKKKGKHPKRLWMILFFWMLFWGILPMIVTNRILIATLKESQITARVQNMQSQALILANQLTSTGYMKGEETETMTLVIEETADIWGGRIQIIDPEFRILLDTYGVDEGRFNISESVIFCMNGTNTTTLDEEECLVAFTQAIYGSEAEGDVQGVILVTVDLTSTVTPIIQVGENMFLLEAAAGVFLLLMVCVILQHSLRPLRRLVQAMDHAAEGNLKEEVWVENYWETRQISQSFNRTLTRMQMLDESRQEFVSNVSHELKTPITSVRVLADSIMSVPNATVELYQEFMQDISDEIERESKIIDDLLTLARMDQKKATLDVEEININEMMERILKRLRPIAQLRNVELLFESFRPVVADVDEGKLTLAINNLVENAIKYNNEGGWVKVSLNADYKFFYVKVSDSGCGIPEDALEHIFERFYRVDKARSRETGGTGLGLSIAKTVVQLHHGAIRVHSSIGEGTTFIMRIPLIYISKKMLNTDWMGEEEE